MVRAPVLVDTDTRPGCAGRCTCRGCAGLPATILLLLLLLVLLLLPPALDHSERAGLYLVCEPSCCAGRVAQDRFTYLGKGLQGRAGERVVLPRVGAAGHGPAECRRNSREEARQAVSVIHSAPQLCYGSHAASPQL
jgi:hypothetical protein